MIRFTIPGDCPSKKNSRRIAYRRSRFGFNRMILLPGDHHEKWKNEVITELDVESIAPDPIGKVKEIELIFYPKTNRKADLSNKAESIMDLLVDVDILEDDNWTIVPRLILRFGKSDKINPRVEVIIKK